MKGEIGPLLEGPFVYSKRPPSVEEAARTLDVHGLIVVEDYLEKAEVDKINGSVRPTFEEILVEREEADAAESLIERERYILTFGGKGYNENRALALQKKKTVVSTRRQADKGMIDAFCVDLMFPSLRGAFGRIQESWIKEAASLASDSRFEHSNLNLYLNRSITQTRGFHVDNWSGHQLKAFIYLTDVLSDADGPHAYITRSHRRRVLSPVNRTLNRIKGRPATDCAVFDRNRQVTVLGRRGTLIVSFQNGVHRGLPQKEGHERIVLVQNYRGGE